MPSIIEHTTTELEEMNCLPVAAYFKGNLRSAIENLPQSYILKSEQELVMDVDPTPLDYELRRSFNKAIDEAEKLQKESIFATQIYKGVCSKQHFDESILPNPGRIAWMIRPIVDHASLYEAINKVALQKILDYVKHNDIKDPKILASIVKIAEMSANRAYGAVAQKMQIQSKNLNIDVTGKQEQNIPSSDQGQLTQRVEELQAKLLDQAKDVTPKE